MQFCDGAESAGSIKNASAWQKRGNFTFLSPKQEAAMTRIARIVENRIRQEIIQEERRLHRVVKEIKTVLPLPVRKAA
jgi:hypothetical protein